MLRSFVILFACAAMPASAATISGFDTAIGITLQATPTEELLEFGGFEPGPSTIMTSGDVSLLTGDDNGTDTCCTGGPFTSDVPVDMGEVALSATGAVNSDGSVMAQGERRALWTFFNEGSATEQIQLTFDINMAISQIIDPLVGGAAASGTEVTISHDGVEIFNQSLFSFTDNSPMAEAFSEIFVYDFDLTPEMLSSQFRFSITGGVHASSDADEVLGTIAPVPLPAAGWMLLAGMGMLGFASRRRAA